MVIYQNHPLSKKTFTKILIGMLLAFRSHKPRWQCNRKRIDASHVQEQLTAFCYTALFFFHSIKNLEKQRYIKSDLLDSIEQLFCMVFKRHLPSNTKYWKVVFHTWRVVNDKHCGKIVCVRSFSGPYFPAFGPETLRIRTLITQWKCDLYSTRSFRSQVVTL